MGSAFTPVKTRGSTPLPPDLGRATGRKRSRLRRPSAPLDAVAEERGGSGSGGDAATVSTAASAASAASSRASHDSGPPLLDFIGTTCFASSAWFTSCFPCAVVDINEGDDYVVDKLSRAAAMEVMYPTPPKPARAAEAPDVTVPADETADATADPTACRAATRSAPAARGSPDVEDAMETISLEDGTGAGRARARPVTPERGDAGLPDGRGSCDDGAVDETSTASPLAGPPKKRRNKFGMKMFSRKTKA